MTTTLGEALPQEMARVRDTILPAYLELEGMPNVCVAPVLFMIRRDLDLAAQALAETDVPAMIRALEALRGYTK